MKQIIALLRPHQWLKNLFIFLPLFFDRRFMDWQFLHLDIFAFLAFSFAASSIYCFNDIWDIEADKNHPKKCNRPIASGAVSKQMGYLLMVVCLIISFTFISLIDRANSSLYLIIGGYFFLNIAYCVLLKQIAIIDVFIIATGFVLRILMGKVAADTQLSHWIVMMTFLLALFLAFAKRRDDVVLFEGSGIKPRKNINRYNLSFLNQVISIIAAITIICYVMYTVSEEVIARLNSPHLYITSIFVLLGMLRYLQLTVVDVKTGSPTKVLIKDHFVQTCVAGWIISFLIILYF